jgi:hypothetical protein
MKSARKHVITIIYDCRTSRTAGRLSDDDLRSARRISNADRVDNARVRGTGTRARFFHRIKNIITRVDIVGPR